MTACQLALLKQPLMGHLKGHNLSSSPPLGVGPLPQGSQMGLPVCMMIPKEWKHRVTHGTILVMGCCLETTLISF